MAKAILTASESSAYKDQIEHWYHFPKTYLGQMQQAVGDLVVYYEPRRDHGPASQGGRQAYFAVARLSHIDTDPDLPSHYYAYLSEFLEFDQPVPFRTEEGTYYESMLRKLDGTTNKGAFGRSVRLIPDEEFDAIWRAGFVAELAPWEGQNGVEEEVPEYVVRTMAEQIVSRPFRDIAFRRHVRAAYANTCAVTGLRLINGGGRPEVQAAHIRAVEANGPDTVRNGIALTGTAHWLFDRGLMSFDDNYNILLSPQGVPDDLDKLIRPERKLLLPKHSSWYPHSLYLAWHRKHRFKQ